jgi:hypothetical protein
MSPAHRERWIWEPCGWSASWEAPIWGRTLAEVWEVGVAARLDDHERLDGIFVTGLAVVAIGSVFYAGAQGAAHASYLVTAAVLGAMAVAFRARTYRARLVAVIGVVGSLALAWQIVSSAIMVPADMVVLSAMGITSVLLFGVLVPLANRSAIASDELPAVIRGQALLRRFWTALYAVLPVIALGDAVSAFTDPSGVVANLGLLVNCFGLLLMVHGLRNVLDVSVRPARSW